MKSEFKSREWLEEISARVADLRQRDVGYGGLEGPFRAIEEKLRIDFKLTGSIRHPGDKGTARENLLRTFLSTEGYLPRRFALAEASSHVLSTTGHISAQIDLLLYDALNTPRLLSVGGIHYFPIESCYGMVESKSDLASRDVVRDGLGKISAFKKLRARRGKQTAASDAFGVLVGYTASLKWATVFAAIEEWQAENEPQCWPNLVVVLDQGAIGHVHDRRLLLHTSEIAQDRGTLAPVAISSDVLLHFYLLLVDLLGAIQPAPAPLRSYVWLPLTAGEHSYQFAHGPIVESATCKKHGPFLRKMTAAAIDRVLGCCPAGSETDGRAQLDAAYGAPLGGTGGPGPVFLYNPDHLDAARILVRPELFNDNGPRRVLGLSYDTVLIDGREYWLPSFYVVRERLVSTCPECAKTDQPSEPDLTIDDWWEGFETIVKMGIEGGPSSIEALIAADKTSDDHDDDE